MWELNLDLIEEWIASLSDDDYDLLIAALQILEREGPELGRPLVDSIKGSRIKNLKELRPGSSGRSRFRILFAFDPQRCAIMLIAGDKAGNWNRWYKTNIPIAERRYFEHLKKLSEELP